MESSMKALADQLPARLLLMKRDRELLEVVKGEALPMNTQRTETMMDACWLVNGEATRLRWMEQLKAEPCVADMSGRRSSDGGERRPTNCSARGSGRDGRPRNEEERRSSSDRRCSKAERRRHERGGKRRSLRAASAEVGDEAVTTDDGASIWWRRSWRGERARGATGTGARGEERGRGLGGWGETEREGGGRT
jgi:hypothetical protein